MAACRKSPGTLRAPARGLPLLLLCYLALSLLAGPQECFCGANLSWPRLCRIVEPACRHFPYLDARYTDTRKAEPHSAEQSALLREYCELLKAMSEAIGRNPSIHISINDVTLWLKEIRGQSVLYEGLSMAWKYFNPTYSSSGIRRSDSKPEPTDWFRVRIDMNTDMYGHQPDDSNTQIFVEESIRSMFITSLLSARRWISEFRFSVAGNDSRDFPKYLRVYIKYFPDRGYFAKSYKPVGGEVLLKWVTERIRPELSSHYASKPGSRKPPSKEDLDPFLVSWCCEETLCYYMIHEGEHSPGADGAHMQTDTPVERITRLSFKEKYSNDGSLNYVGVECASRAITCALIADNISGSSLEKYFASSTSSWRR